ncbi:hypothetical protein [Muricoccus aerilatus]|uniref:hypothetical protein n=1 Tax=Muricoccus aerilatus TaxID=452982 RepID=UPI0005C25061|nr:hypothetical protein [Roseomonas aerilata]
MSASTDVQLSRYAVEDARPTTFLERGVTVPFTTPMLLGSRVRPAQRRNLEVAIPSPAGVRGFYILPLQGISDICAPTLHDRLMLDVMESLSTVAPNTILRIARAAAQEGLAGRAAAAAALAAERTVSGQKTLTNYLLLLRLVAQLEHPSEGRASPESDTPADVQARAKRAVARLAQSLGLTPERVFAALESLAEAYLDLGLPGDPTKARYQQQLSQIEALSAEAASWAETATDAHLASSASLISRSAFFTLNCGRVLLVDLLALVDDLSALVQRWTANPDAILAELGKLAWLLDGWSIIASIWGTAEQIGVPAAIREMSVMVPSMPLEVNQWVRGPEKDYFAEAHRRHSRLVSRLEEWRTGRVLELIQRNEMIVKSFV